jgi:hypothetical protein
VTSRPDRLAVGLADLRRMQGLVQRTWSAGRRSLAGAVNVALLHAFGELGGTCAVILPRGDDAYPAPGLLYRGLGYTPGPRTIRYVRRLPDASR